MVDDEEEEEEKERTGLPLLTRFSQKGQWRKVTSFYHFSCAVVVVVMRVFFFSVKDEDVNSVGRSWGCYLDGFGPKDFDARRRERVGNDEASAGYLQIIFFLFWLKKNLLFPSPFLHPLLYSFPAAAPDILNFDRAIACDTSRIILLVQLH